MPVLPSGRRIEFSLDRFHALLGQMDGRQAAEIVETLRDPDDLLFVLDAVHFGREDDAPFFADYMAANWKSYAAEWSAADRDALAAWLASDDARYRRAEAIEYIKALLLDRHGNLVAYPYVIPADQRYPATHEGSRLRQ